jgi:membrane associated rhomboid family serine protease
VIPLRDSVRTYTFPTVNIGLIGINTLVFVLEIRLSPAALERLFANFGLVSAHLQLADPLALLANPIVLVTFITYLFLHGGWLHYLSNIWTLYIFGDNVEDRMGSARYLFFYLLIGALSGLLQALIAPQTWAPLIGASGAIAGVLGAFFMLYPRARVFTLIIIVIFPWFVNIPALIYLRVWFVLQLFSGISTLSLPAVASAGGVAWWAHIGGFILGIVLYRFFIPPVHPAYQRHVLRKSDKE